MTVEEMPVEPQVEPRAQARLRARWKQPVLIAVVLILLGGLMARFYAQTRSGLNDRGSMDIAQVAVNIMEGKGFTTRVLRPLNVAMVTPRPDGLAPEVNHAPASPYAVAAAFKLRHAGSDQVIMWISLIFFFLAAVAAFALGAVLFDWKAGLLAAVVFGLSLAALQAGTSGREWSMEAWWFTLVLLSVALHHRSASAGRNTAALLHSMAAGLWLGALYMTNYATAVFIVPLAVYFAVMRASRKLHTVGFLLAAIVVMAPCAYRNYQLTEFPVMGVRAWDLMANTAEFPGDVLYRCTDTEYSSVSRVLIYPIDEFGMFSTKLITRSRDLAADLMPMLGYAVLPLALVSALYKFKRADANAVRGLMYGLFPVALATFALLGEGGGALLIFVPVASVFASAYFLLLVEAKKLHPVFARMMIAAWVLLAISQALPAMIWRPEQKTLTDRELAAARFFADMGSKGYIGVIYTDVPWQAAWRTRGFGVWLPYTDDDVISLEGRGLAMRLIALTPECERYSWDEIWHVLHRVKLWQTYFWDASEGVKQALKETRVSPDQTELASKYLRRFKRDYAVSETITGFVPARQDPFSAADVQVFIHPDLATPGNSILEE